MSIDYTRGDSPIYDGHREAWASQREEELQARIDELEAEVDELNNTDCNECPLIQESECEEICKSKGSLMNYIQNLLYELAGYRKAEADGRLVLLMPQKEFDRRLEKLRSENWKVNALYRDCGGIPPHLEEKFFDLLEVRKLPSGYIDTRKEAEAALQEGTE